MAISQGNNHTFSSGQLVTADKLNKVKVVQTGTTAENTEHTGPAGQLTYDTDTSKLRVHDGSTAGGKVVATSPVASTDIADGAVGATQLATGAVGADQLASDAVTNEKIAEGAVSTENLKESGSGAISVQQIIPKTVTIHVGNYHYIGTKQFASDLYNYNSSTDTYGARTTVSRDFTAGTSAGSKGWGSNHYDLKELLVVEPFATYIAGMRYVLQNHGAGTSVLVICHGHVSAYGTYDLVDTSSDHSYKDVANFDNFRKISIQGGAPPDYSNNDADYQVFKFNPKTPARIDHDNTVRHTIGAQGSDLAYWYRGPNVTIFGTNQVFTSNVASAVAVRYGVTVNHQFANNRVASAGSVSYLSPYVFLENALAFFSSGQDNPNEWYFQNAGKLFQTQSGSQAIYSNNGANHIYIDGANTSSNLIEFCNVLHGSSFQFKNNSNVYYKSGNTYQAFGTGQYPVYLFGAFNQFRTTSDDFFVGEQGIGHSGATIREDYNYVKHEGTGTIDTDAENRLTYSNIATELGTLHNRYSLASEFISSNASLNASRICGQSNVKSAPTSRTGTGGTSSDNAPYSDQ